MIWNRLSPIDARWLMLESGNTPMHIGALLTFTLPDQAPDTFLHELANGFRDIKAPVPPWNHKFKGGLAKTLAPAIEEVQDIDLGYHFRHLALPHPGGERELGILVSRLHSHPLDKQRPLWEVHLIEGLQQQRFAVYLKLHPALIKGADIGEVLQHTLSESPHETGMRPFWAINMTPEHAAQGRDDNRYAEFLERLSRSTDSLLSTGRATADALKHIVAKGLKSPHLAPRSSLNGSVNEQRRFATQQYDYRRLEVVASAANCTTNTIIAYLCGSALRRFFKEYNALPDTPLIASGTLPLAHASTTDEKQPLADINLSLATHIADPLKRLQAVNRSLLRANENLTNLNPEAHTPYALMLSLPQFTRQLPGIGSLVPNLYNVGISSTRVGSAPLYFNGAQLQAIYPMAHLLQHSALRFDCAVYAGTLNIGITGARDTLPRLQRMALYMDQALNNLETLLAIDEATL